MSSIVNYIIDCFKWHKRYSVTVKYDGFYYYEGYAVRSRSKGEYNYGIGAYSLDYHPDTDPNHYNVTLYALDMHKAVQEAILRVKDHKLRFLEMKCEELEETISSFSSKPDLPKTVAITTKNNTRDIIVYRTL